MSRRSLSILAVGVAVAAAAGIAAVLFLGGDGRPPQRIEVVVPQGAGALGSGVDTAELHAPFSHQELILRRELGLADDVRINPSGGPLASNPMFTGGLIRIGEAARQIWDGRADKVLGHATSGPALQQNLVCVMDSQDRNQN